MILVRLLRVKQNGRAVFKADLGETCLTIWPDPRSPDQLILEIDKRDQPDLFGLDPGEKGKAGGGSNL